MSNMYGMLGMQDRDATVDQVGQQSVFDAVNQYALMYEVEANKMAAIFIEDENWIYTEKVKLPGGGEMQESDRLSDPETTKRTGGYDVGYPIYDARDALGWDDVSLAYMTIVELDAHIATIETRMLNWKRRKILRALFNNANEVVNDERFGNITVRRLANGDTQPDGNNTLYPPVLGATSEATENHYLIAGYVSSSISNSNNPFPVVKDELEEHFGEGNLVTLINSAQRDKVTALSSFVPVTQMHTLPGANITTMQGQTDSPDSRLSPGIPGKLLGAVSDNLIYEWRWIPADYMLTIDTNQSKPLRRRVDQPASLRGFQLVADDERYPLRKSRWRLREGYGTRNRLNGVITQFKASGNYDIPTQFA